MNPLVVYYSHSGITRRLAEDIALILAGDLRELKPEKPYSFSYNITVKEARAEIEKRYCPPLLQDAGPIETTGVIFIGSPNWLKNFTPPVRSFLRTVDLSGKTIIPFCTHGGGSFGIMMEEYKKECKNSTIKEGIALKGDYSFDELRAWLDSHLKLLEL